MIGTLRRHSKVLWWFVIIVVIVSFVIFFSPHQPSGAGRSMARGYGMLYGERVRAEDFDQAHRLAQLSIRLQGNQARIGREEIARQAYQILFLQAKMRQMGIHPGDESVAQFMRRSLVDPETGRNNYQTIVDNVKSQGFTEGDYIEFMRLQLGIQHLSDLIQVPAALVTPQQAEASFHRENEQALLTALVFSLTNHQASVEMDEGELGTFFTNRLATYRVQERRQLMYLHFASSNYLDEARVELDKMPEIKAELEAFYEQQGPDAFRDDEDQPMSREAAIADIMESQVENVAVNLARRDAVEFYNALAQGQPDLEGFQKLAAEKELEIQETQPVGGFDFVPELASIRNLNQILNQLTVDMPFSEPLATQEGVFLLALKEIVPSRAPALEEVRARVALDFRRSRALELAKEEGQIFRVIATNAVAGGKTLEQIAEEQGLKPIELPPLTMAMNTVPGLPASIDLQSLKNAAFTLQPGELSELIPSRDGGFLVQLREKRAPEEESVQAAIGSYLEEMRDRNRQQVFNTWFSEEFERSGLAEHIRRLTDPDSDEG